MSRILSFIFVIFVFSSCLRLDDNLFNPFRIEAYLFDQYEGGDDFGLDASFDISEENIHLFTLNSNDAGDIKTIYASYIGDIQRISSDTVILYCHGNTGHMDSYWQRTKILANLGHKHRFGVMTLDYRGFGMSEGRATETGMYADVQAAIQWLRTNGLSGDRLVIYGFSLGTAPTVELTARPRGNISPHKILLEAPFASSNVMVHDASSIVFPRSFFTNNRIANAEKIKEVQQPLFWIHGVADDFLAMKTHGEVVFANHRGDFKVGVRVPGANHGDVPKVMGVEPYMEAVLDFLLRRSL